MTSKTSRRRTAAPAPPGPRRAPFPGFVPLQLATLVGAPPTGDAWLHETKFDGYRILCGISRGRAVLWSRNARDWTAHFPGVAHAALTLPVRDALLDGEVAALLPDGTTRFQDLQNALSGEGRARLVYFVFDLLHLDGLDLRPAPLEARKATLEGIVPGRKDSVIRYSSHVVGQGEAVFREACRLSFEGIVSKLRDRPYEPGRTRSWLKVKCVHEQEFVVAGFTEPKGARTGLGALLLGVYDEAGELVYAGKVGTGFTEASIRALRKRLDGLRIRECPFRQRPPGAASALWVKPELVAEVEFTEWTADGRLRHPSFKGLREDKASREVVRERPRSARTAESPP